MPPLIKDSTPFKVTVGATTTEILAANGNREYALIQNDSDEVIYIAKGVAAVLNTGIRLNASGGSYEMSRLLGNLSQGAVNGICTSGSKVACGEESSVHS